MDSKLRQLRSKLTTARNNPATITNREVRGFIMRKNLDVDPDGRDVLGSLIPVGEQGRMTVAQIDAMLARIGRLLNPAAPANLDDVIVLSSTGMSRTPLESTFRGIRLPVR